MRTLPQYLATCRDCEWYFFAGTHPNTCRKKAKRHALACDSHQAAVINLLRLETVTTFVYSAMLQVEDPPF